ncbi:RagB/SusD family nutrient uptake outer membrane protein [Fibrisoma montanum]|uniref:RagB/SusD family nutrient uptake outer membrane protein n=1 Tax=Fibrisoma montanum TaxID=2305895 RepID=A0A418LWB2_9BACT|nr:RagB/SusD family nutrient uptake outer membrane protein [Fibrisoma montanum]RIV17584.1 RagB/SusD family nutrient uptake outer membrane protein [Fibrisoma montanum]
MKSITNRFLTTALTGALLLGGQSCSESFLERNPQGEEIVQDFFQSEDGAIKATNAIYAHLRAWQTHVFAFIAVSSLTSDDAEKGSDPTDAPFMGEFDQFTMTPTNFILNDYWTGQYQGINRCNEVIQRVPEITAINTTLRDRLVGEARFMRAYFYFNLVRTFGGVPRVTNIVQAGDPPQPRASREEIYQLIEQDLNAAIGVLPEKSGYPVADLGRATKGAAKGLLAKVAMYQKRWADVLRLTDEIIASNEYNLNTPYERIFTEAGENSSESLFEVQNAALPQCGGGSQYAEVQSVRGQLGWGFNVPSNDLINSAYEPGDPRREATIIFPGETLFDGVIINRTTPNPAYNQKAYVAQSETRSACGIGDSNKNIRILRYADVMLMNAEAANELGNGAQAAQRLNAVRARARGSRTGVLPDVAFTDQAQMRPVIWRERRVELAMEHDRFWDLVRQGRAAQVLRAVGKNFTPGVNEVMPIPQTQIDASGGVLTQNPGY